jgi:hypothetical protein
MATIGSANSSGRQGFLWIMMRPSMAGGTGKVKTHGVERPRKQAGDNPTLITARVFRMAGNRNNQIASFGTVHYFPRA